MVNRLLSVLIIAAMLICFAGAVADDSGGSGGSDLSGPDDNSNDTAGDNSRDHPGDNPVSPDATGSGENPVSPDTTGSGDSSPSASDTADRSGTPDSRTESGMQNGTEPGIEHALSTISAREGGAESSMAAAGTPDPADPARSHDSAMAAATSLSALAGVPAPVSTQLAEDAKKIEDTMPHFEEAERAIRNRDWFSTMLFGGDMNAADDILIHAEEDSATLDAMEQLVNDPTTSPALKAFTLQRIARIRADLLRLRSIAVTEQQKTGLIGMFGSR